MNMTKSSGLQFPKPPKRSTVRRKRRDIEATMVRLVRAACVARDGYCRVGTSQCQGPSEWAHWGAYKRARTRGQAAGARHATFGSLMLCRFHHRAYDAGELEIEPETNDLCDGPLQFAWR